MKLSLVIPMYNEQSIIEEAISTFYGFLKEKYEDFELIFVSDGSTDGCDNTVALAAKNDDRIKLCSYMP
ncbi:MAG: glycosyltransferase, partial [Clostridia bacterium]|nr:glycosyltransferase [Clostridia bacterium]